MGDGTGIEWTDATWNPVVGCSVVSPGCTNCYAMRQALRIQAMMRGQGKASHYDGTTKLVNGNPVWTGVMRQAPEHILLQPLRWTQPRRIFVNSMSDLFHEDVPDEWIDKVFAVMAAASRHTFQVLTKRADRMRSYFRDVERRAIAIGPLADSADLLPLPNVWLGVSAEDQRRADERIPHLLATPAAIRFVSAEPLLGPIDLSRLPSAIRGEDGRLDALTGKHHSNIGSFGDDAMPSIDWVIVGGESGPEARPMHPDWARSLRDQCAAAGVPFFFKQWGEFAPEGLPNQAWHVWPDGAAKPDPLPNGIGRHVPVGHSRTYRVGKKAAGRLLDGAEHNGMPEVRS